MYRSKQLIILAALAITLFITIFPPVHSTSYDNSDGIARVRPAIQYKYLFEKSPKEIYYNRLLLQYLIVSIITIGLILVSEKTSKSLAVQVTQTSAANEKLRKSLTKTLSSEKNLKQQQTEFTTEKQSLKNQIDELRKSKQQWQKYRDQLEQHIEKQSTELTSLKQHIQNQLTEQQKIEEYSKQQVLELTKEKENFQSRLEQRIAELSAELDSTNKRLQKEIDGHRQTEEELTIANDKIQLQINQCKILEEKFLEQQEQYNQLLKEHSAQKDWSHEKMQEDVDNSGQLKDEFDQNDESDGQMEIPPELFDVEQLKKISDLAKRLSQS